jgi:uncharacterized membrane protein
MAPGAIARLLAVSFYFGLAPLLAWARRCREDAFVRHHAGQALVLLLVAATAGVLGLLISVGWAWVIIAHREVIEALPYGFDWVVCAAVLLLLAAAWLLGITTALAGSSRRLPLLGRLAARPRVRRIAFVVNCAAWVCVGLVAGLALHASSLCRAEGPAPVCVLYDDMGVAPRWLFNLGAYRIALTARERWGEGSVAVVPLDPTHLEQALGQGRMVVLLCHGRDGCIIKEDLTIMASPDAVFARDGLRRWVCVREGITFEDRWDTVAVGKDLQLVYITACDGGRHAERWQEVFRPAEVVTFDRLSAMLEHVWWLWLDAPGRVRDLPLTGSDAPRGR